MNTTTHKSLTLTALALALTVTAGSAFAATQSCSTFGYTPRADIRADFLVSLPDDGAIAPRSLDPAALLAWQNNERIAPRSVGPTDKDGRIAPDELIRKISDEVLHILVTDEALRGSDTRRAIGLIDSLEAKGRENAQGSSGRS